MKTAHLIALSPARIALLYTLIGALWILFSDRLLAGIPEPHVRAWIGMAKGWVFVGVTALLLYGLMRRLVESIRAQEALIQREQSEKLRALHILNALAEGTDDAIFAKDTEGRYLLVNRAACRYVGKSADAILGHDDYALFPPAEAELLMATCRSVIAHDRIETHEEFLTTIEGDKIFLATKGPIHDGGGRVIGLFGIRRDITAARSAQKIVEQERSTLRTLIRTIPDLVWLKNPQGIYLTCNPAFEHFFGAPESAIIGETDDAFIEQALADAFRADGRAAMAAGGPRNKLEWVTKASDGRRALLETTKIPMHADDGHLIGVLGIARDVTQQHRMLSQLSESENRFRTIVDCMPVAYQALDGSGCFLEVNPAFSALLGYRADQLIGRSFGELWSAEPQVQFDQYLKQFVGVDRTESELALITAEGRVIQVLLQGNAQTDADGRLVCIHCVLFDITARKQNEARLLAARSESARLLSEADQARRALLSVLEDERHASIKARQVSDRLNHYLAVSPVVTYALMVRDEQVRTLWVSENVTALLGYTLQEAQADGWWSTHLHPTDRDAALSGLAVLFREGRLSHQYRFLRKDGSVLWIYDELRLVRDSAGIPSQIVGAWHDVTVRKQAEDALQESERRFKTLASISPVGIFRTDTHGNCLYVNPRWQEIAGMSAEQALGQGWQNALHPDDRPAVAEAWAEAALEKRLFFKEYRFLRPDGRVYWVLGQSVAEHDEQGTVNGYIGTITDISERKQAEEAIRALNAELESRVRQRTAELEATNKELESFTYSVSHDLRAPLRAINGFSQILAERYGDRLDETARHYLDNVLISARHMGVLIDDLLYYSRVGQSPLRLQPISLQALLTNLETERSNRITEGGARLIVCHPLATPLGDPTLLRQILANLIDNALTYRRQDVMPEVRVTTTTENDVVLIDVSDNGIGIAPEYHERIFEVFQRLHSEEEFPGTGIGLAIVRKAARLMGGDVGIQSIPGLGSTFQVRLPEAK